MNIKDNSLNVRLSNSQLNKLKPAIKNKKEAIWDYHQICIGNSNDKINYLHELLLTKKHTANLCKSFASNSSNDIKLSKTQISKMIKSGGFLGRLLDPLLRAGLTLMENVMKPLAKSILSSSGLTTAAAASDARIRKILVSATITLIISYDEIEDIIIIVKSLEDSGLLLKGVSETIQNEAKERKGS